MPDSMENTNLLGRRVIARTKDGPVEGVVDTVLTRDEAAKRMDGDHRGAKFLRSGRYLVVRGVPYPVRRARCKLVSE